MREEHHPPSPTLTLDHAVLRYGNEWSLPVADVRVIGEYTTTGGPVAQDYFIVFIDGAGKSYDLPADALDASLTDRLRESFHPLKFRLHRSTKLKSRIIWPPEHAEADVYTFTPLPPRTLGDYVRRFFGTSNVTHSLSPAAQAAVRAEADDPIYETTVTMVAGMNRAAAYPAYGGPVSDAVGARQRRH